MSATDRRAAFIAGLRKLAEVLEQHPGLELPYIASNGVQWYPRDDKEAVAAIARTLPCALAKRTWDSDTQSYLELAGHLAGLKVEIHAYRDAVCTRRVTGTEEREVEEVVQEAVTRKVTKQVEVVEWDCGPILRPEALPPAQDGGQ